MTELEILKRIKKLFGPNGEHWGRGELHSVMNETFCIVGAYREIMNPGSTHWFGGDSYMNSRDNMPQLCRVISENHGIPNNSSLLWSWNDKYAVDWMDIENTLNEAIRRLEISGINA